MSDEQTKQETAKIEDQTQTNGETQKDESDSTLKLPEKLQGKSPEEVTKMYLDLEKKLGEQSGDIEAARELEKQLTPILNVIWADPELFKTIKARLSGDTEEVKQKVEGEDKKEEVKEPQTPPETKKYLQDTIVSNFEVKYGIDKLEQEQRKGIWQKVFSTVAELVDPGGKLPPAQIIDSISLDKLPKFLENAYLLVSRSNEIEAAKDKGKAQAMNNQRATIGNMTSGSAGEEESISDAEKAVMQKMGMSEEDWLKSKTALEAQFKQ